MGRLDRWLRRRMLRLELQQMSESEVERLWRGVMSRPPLAYDSDTHSRFDTMRSLLLEELQGRSVLGLRSEE